MMKMAKKTFSLEFERDHLHTSIGGGFPAGSVMMIEGEETCGKSAISQRFTYGFLKNDITVTYITTELSVQEFINQMYSLGYNISNEMLSGQLEVISVYPMLKGLKNRDRFLDILMNSKKLYTKDILIVDTFSSLISQCVQFVASSSETTSFFKKITSGEKMIILTVDPQEVNERALNQLRADVSIYAKLGLSRFAGAIVRGMEFKRYIAAPGRIQSKTSFRIEPGIGFVAEITETA